MRPRSATTMPRASSGSSASATACAPDCTPRFAPAERLLRSLYPLAREHVVFEHEVVRNGGRDYRDARDVRLQRRMQQSGLWFVQLAAVAPSTFGIEKEIVPSQQFRYVRLQRDEIDGVLRVAAHWHGAGDMPVQKSERAPK